MRTLCAQEITRPSGHHNQRGDAHFEQNGVIAQPRIRARLLHTRGDFRWGGQRLQGGAHALTALGADVCSAMSTVFFAKCRRTCSSRTKVAASSSAPMVTWATVVLTMLGNGCTAFLPQTTRVRYAANPKPSCTSSRPIMSAAGLRRVPM